MRPNRDESCACSLARSSTNINSERFFPHTLRRDWAGRHLGTYRTGAAPGASDGREFIRGLLFMFAVRSRSTRRIDSSLLRCRSEPWDEVGETVRLTRRFQNRLK
ncbi:hypothetical protein EVAR_54413_1 [Eumeta japonica]|uniref:Uncharacterized protein n=1 Tax=Eumeta variegata TaxID=151549 RepID=A0A4C1Y8S6_EUMVA|nr:hypothetical protein EVAR_54413_1 [Eumeta japonica]